MAELASLSTDQLGKLAPLALPYIEKLVSLVDINKLGSLLDTLDQEKIASLLPEVPSHTTANFGDMLQF